MKLQKTHIIVLLVLVLAVAIGILYATYLKPQAEFDAQNAVETVSRPEVGLEFGYLAGPDALSMVEPPVEGEPLQAAFILLPSQEYVEIHNNPEQNTEAPPSISLFVFTKPDLQSATATANTEVTGTTSTSTETVELSRLDELRQWAMTNQNLTSIHLALAEPEETELDGLTGLRYTADGLYRQDIQLFSYRDRIYMFVGQYMSEDDPLRQYYTDILSTIHFD